jgi:hypothetical protein
MPDSAAGGALTIEPGDILTPRGAGAPPCVAVRAVTVLGLETKRQGASKSGDLDALDIVRDSTLNGAQGNDD